MAFTTFKFADDGSNIDSEFDFDSNDEELKNVAIALFVNKFKKILKC